MSRVIILGFGRTARLASAASLVLLYGCAGAPTFGPSHATTTGAANQAGNAGAKAKQEPPVAPQVQADFDAAMALVKAGQNEQATEAFKKLAVAVPDNPIPVINLALVYEKLDKPDLAEAELKKALAIEPDNPVASNELALLYRKAGRFADARAVYEKTLAKYPNFTMAHKNLGVLCDLYLKDYPCAIEHYKTYASSVPGDKSVQIWIADLQKRTAAKDRP
jgi:tetratricopeptide (TPR) repeat protein